MTAGSTASDFRTPRGAPAPRRAHLFVAMHCAAPLDPPSRHALHGIDEVQVGRGSERKVLRQGEEGNRRLILTLRDARVSSAHARLLSRDGSWHIEDLASKNGTFVNGAVTRTASLADGDIIQIGQTLLILRTAMSTPARTDTDKEATGCVPALATLVPLFARDLDVLAIAAASSVPVLLMSETGTGKELLARTVHALSRRPGAFVPVNCGGLPQSLAESVLFGHKRGAFSGSIADHPGLFGAASGGTLLLDEVGDMAPSVQAAVLRALQDGEVLAVGETRATHVDIRVVAATHRNLDALVREGGFREDLLARLSGFTFRLPALSERREDIGILVGHILRSRAPERGHDCSLSTDVGLRLLRHSWPQNARQLERCLTRAVAVSSGRLELDHLPEGVFEGMGLRAPLSSDEEMQARLVKLLDQHRGNVSAVATLMRTSRSQIHRWMKRFGIEPMPFRQ